MRLGYNASVYPNTKLLSPGSTLAFLRWPRVLAAKSNCVVALRNSAVALTQIPAYITHKNLAVRKIMEAMSTAYAKKRDSVSTRLKQNVTQTITERKRASFAKNIYFAESFDELSGKGAFEMRHSFLYFVSSLRISEFLYANFFSTCGVRMLLKS